MSANEKDTRAIAIKPNTKTETKTQTLVLPSGRALETESHEEEDIVRVRSPKGAYVLTIKLTDEGPVVRVEGGSLEVSAAKKLSLDCDELAVRARQNATIELGGALKVDASAIELRANDDVSLHGERVLLNSDDPPMPMSWDEYEARHGTVVSKALPERSPSKAERDD